MRFKSSPESDDPIKQSQNLTFEGPSPLLTPAERNDSAWKQFTQSSQETLPNAFEQSLSKARQDYSLPSLELQFSQPRATLPKELLALYGDFTPPSLKEALEKAEADEKAEPKTGADNNKPDATERANSDYFAAVPPTRVNDAGFVTDVNYPDGKIRHIERDQRTQEPLSITTQNQEGTTKMVKKGDSWFMEVQGMELPFAGKVEVSKDGEVAMQTAGNGIWRVEKPNGVITEEKENADGARASFDSNHQLTKITRQDGTTFEQLDQNRIVETHAGGKPVTWSNIGGLWSSDTGEKPRKNMAMHDNASVTFEDANAVKHTISGRGLETLEGAGLGKITPDQNGRPAEVETADGQKIRKYDYFDGGNDVKSVTIVDKKNNSSTTYTRESQSATHWRNERGNSWNGDIKVSPDGVHSVREKAWNSKSGDDGGKWTSHHPDGRETTDTVNADGSRASYDKGGALVSFRGPDGVRIDQVKIDGTDVIQHYDPKIGESVNWKKGPDGTWSSDSPRFKDSRKDLQFNTNGELNFVNDKGGRVQEHRDGTKQIVEKDGTKLDFDKDGLIQKATKGSLERTFLRNGSGEISVVKDRNLSNKEERTIFERRPGAEENRSNIHVAANGDLSYQNPDGSAVIERSSMLHVDLDKDGDITRVVGPKLTRTYSYIGEGENKAIVNIKDEKKSDKGIKTENWTRVANPDGSLSNEFRSKQDDGKDRKPRYGLTPCADGEYEYKLATDKPGDKIHVERMIKDSADGMPDSVDDARQELASILEGVMDKVRLDMNMGFMKQFEQRMMDQTELQIAAGLDPDKVMRETEKCIVETYFNCARLAGTSAGPKEMYGLKDRVRLAENLLYLANNPSDIKQGGQGTCWWESSWNVGLFQRNAGCAARLCADVALTSQYTSTAGPLKGGPSKTIKIPANYVGLNSRDSGAGWTPMNSKNSSQRSMVGMLIDQIGPPLGGQRGWGQSNAGWHTEARNILYMMTGRDAIRHGGSSLGRHEKLELLKTGGWTSSGNGHMWGYSMHKDKAGGWVVIRDDQYQGNDRVIQKIANLKQWIGSDVQNDVRTQWRASKPRPGESNDSSSYQASFKPTQQSYNRTRYNEDDDRTYAQLKINKPKWQDAKANRYS